MSSSAIARAVARGRLHPVQRGVYALVPLLALPAPAREQAAVLACGPRSLISHASAAALWGLCSSEGGPVTLTVVGSEAGRSRPGIIAPVASWSANSTRSWCAD